MSVRRPSLILAAALPCALLACIAPTDPPGEPESIAEAPQRQFPIDPDVTEIAFDSSSPFMRYVVTSDALPSGSSFRPRTEYATATHSIDVTTLTSLSLATAWRPSPSDTQVQAFLQPSTTFDTGLVGPQVVSTSDWSHGAYVSSAAKKRLFKAVDPDDSSRFIGLLIEQDASSVLTGVVWYKSVLTGTIFAATPASATFSPVTDGLGNASTDPADIDANASFYHYVMH